MVPFLSAFQVTRASAFNHYWVHNTVSVTVERGNTEQQVADAFKDVDGYLLPGTPSYQQMASSPGDQTFVSEWFRKVNSHDKIPPKPSPGPYPRALEFKPRSRAQPTTVQASAEFRFGSSSPADDFQ